jgi:hypothetical protein
LGFLAHSHDGTRNRKVQEDPMNDLPPFFGH